MTDIYHSHAPSKSDKTSNKKESIDTHEQEPKTSAPASSHPRCNRSNLSRPRCVVSSSPDHFALSSVSGSSPGASPRCNVVPIPPSRITTGVVPNASGGKRAENDMMAGDEEVNNKFRVHNFVGSIESPTIHSFERILLQSIETSRNRAENSRILENNDFIISSNPAARCSRSRPFPLALRAR